MNAVKDNKGKISIIVAVYKAEKYLKRCVESIISQTYKNIEVILVDDGSPDKSGVICDYYSHIDKRVLSIHQENKGVSGARENGLQHATGEYVIHVDPDDWIDEQTIEILYSKAIEGNYDIVACDFCFEYRNGEKQILHSFPSDISDRMNLFEKVMKGKVVISNCNKIVRINLFRKYHIHFPIGYNRWEDYYISCLLFSHLPNTAYINKPLYHVDRFSNDNSISRDVSKEELTCLKHYLDLFKKELPHETLKYISDAKIMVKNCAFFRLGDSIDSKTFNSIYPEIRKQFVLSHLSIHPHELGPALAGIGFFKLGKYIYSKRRGQKK